jgi:hypothetical protein
MTSTICDSLLVGDLEKFLQTIDELAFLGGTVSTKQFDNSLEDCAHLFGRGLPEHS